VEPLHEDNVRRSGSGGFTLLETIVAMFVLLMGLLGIFSVFGSGVYARLQAQELIITQDLANQWAEWVRFRLNEARPQGGAQGILHRINLNEGASGDFYQDTGTLNFSPPGDPRNLPTFQRSIYRGYRWEITKVDNDYRPKWSVTGGAPIDWDKRGDNAPVVPPAMGSGPRPLTEVELKIDRGARRYPFTFVFSGVGLKYD
jgi:type II secretory pathway pseudopilin PulG